MSVLRFGRHARVALFVTVMTVAGLTFGGAEVAGGQTAPGDPCAYVGYAPPSRCRPRPTLPPPNAGSPDVTMSKTARSPVPWGPGSFQWFDFTVTNVGTASTQGALTLTDSLPAALTLTGDAQYSGDGWSCVRSTGNAGFTCTYPYLLAPGAVTPTLAVRVQVDPVSPPTGTINFAAVATPGDADPSNNNANTGYIPLSQPPPPLRPADLTLTKSHTGNFTSGQAGQYRIGLVNVPDTTDGSAYGPIVVTDRVPAGLRVVSAEGGIFGDWECSVPPTDLTRSTVVTCTHAAGAAATEETLAYDEYVGVVITVVPDGVCAPNVPAVVRINTASVAAPVNGDADMADNQAEDYTTILCNAQPEPIEPGAGLD